MKRWRTRAKPRIAPLKSCAISASPRARKAINVIRRMCVAKAKEWGEIEFAETKIGRLDHKIEKLKICGDLVPGVEFLERMAFSGDFGLTIIDFAPWGVDRCGDAFHAQRADAHRQCDQHDRRGQRRRLQHAPRRLQSARRSRSALTTRRSSRRSASPTCSPPW